MTYAHRVKRWGVMLRVHRRDRYIPKVFDTLRKLARGRRVALVVMADRPSSAVLSALDRQLKQIPSNIKTRVVDAPFPLVGAGEKFMQALQIHYEYLLDLDPALDAASLWDDDMWLQRAGIRELRGHLDYLDYDRLDARSYFLWDHPDQANEAFPPHWQALVFRVYRGDQFPTTVMTHAPEKVAFSRRAARLTNRLWNAGYFSADERQQLWDKYRRAGKIDAHTRSLVRPPKLVKVS